MKIKKPNYRIIAAAVLFLAAGAVSALAWMQHTTYPSPGTYPGPGYVGPVDWVGAEGGVCGAPDESIVCDSRYDQMFVNRYVAYSTSAAVAQNIQSTAHLYYWNGSSWQHLLSNNYGTCRNRAGGGNGWCNFGSPAPDLEPGCAKGTYTCTPAFYNLPADGRSWTVDVTVTWRNAAIGALIAQAIYHPRGTAESEIRCAPWAQKNLKRCWDSDGWDARYNVKGYAFINMW